MQYRACNVYSAHSIPAVEYFWPQGGAVRCSENIEIGSYRNVKKHHTILKNCYAGLYIRARIWCAIWRDNIPVKAMNILPVAWRFHPVTIIRLRQPRLRMRAWRAGAAPPWFRWSILPNVSLREQAAVCPQPSHYARRVVLAEYAPSRTTGAESGEACARLFPLFSQEFWGYIVRERKN